MKPTIRTENRHGRTSALRMVLLAIAAIAATCGVTAQVRETKQGAMVFDTRKGDDLGKFKEAQAEQRKKNMRDDVLWHAEAANVVYRKAGNVSLLSASRYGMTERLELSTYLAEDVVRPIIYAKLLIGVFNKKWFASSRFDIANAYPGMKIAQKLEVDRIIKQGVKIPLVFEVGHELLVSRAWFTDPNCSDNSVYFILTGGIGLYGSFRCNKADTLDQPRFHFMANRSETLIDKGFRARFKLWADGRLTNRLYAHGGVAYHTGFFSCHHAVELQAEGEFFFNRSLSAKLGVLASFAHYRGISNHAAAWPIVDVTYYFGKRRTRDLSLFDQRTIRRRKL